MNGYPATSGSTVSIIAIWDDPKTHAIIHFDFKESRHKPARKQLLNIAGTAV